MMTVWGLGFLSHQMMRQNSFFSSESSCAFVGMFSEAASTSHPCSTGAPKTLTTPCFYKTLSFQKMCAVSFPFKEVLFRNLHITVDCHHSCLCSLNLDSLPLPLPRAPYQPLCSSSMHLKKTTAQKPQEVFHTYTPPPPGLRALISMAAEILHVPRNRKLNSKRLKRMLWVHVTERLRGRAGLIQGRHQGLFPPSVPLTFVVSVPSLEWVSLWWPKRVQLLWKLLQIPAHPGQEEAGISPEKKMEDLESPPEDRRISSTLFYKCLQSMYSHASTLSQTGPLVCS